MKLINILQSQVARLGKISGIGGGAIYGVHLSKSCEERYGFLQGPRVLADYDLGKGVTFLHGYFDNRFVIDKFQVFENGLFAEARIDSDNLDAFLDDVTNWISETGGMTFERDLQAHQIYESKLEIETSADLKQAFKTFMPIGRQIADVLRGYKMVTPDWEPAGISFGTVGAGDAASFKFERREGNNVPHDVFFAAAHMRTKDHLKILESLEAIMTNAS